MGSKHWTTEYLVQLNVRISTIFDLESALVQKVPSVWSAQVSVRLG